MNTIATSELFWVILAGYVFFVLGADYFLREIISQRKISFLGEEDFHGG